MNQLDPPSPGNQAGIPADDPEPGSAPRPAPARLLEECGFCHRPVIWVTLSNGSRRTFEPFEYRTVTLDSHTVEQRGFGLRADHTAKPLNCVSRWPRWTLLAHICSEYLQALDERRHGVSRLSDVLDTGLPVRASVSPGGGRRGRRGTRRDLPAS